MAIRNLQYILSGSDKGASKVFDKVGKSAEGLGSKFKGLSAAGLGAAGLGAGVGAAVTKGFLDTLDFEKATDRLEAQIGAGSPLAASAGKVAGKLYADAYGESIAETGEAVRQVFMNGLVDEDASDEVLQGVTARAMDVAAVFGQDVTAVISSVGQLLKNDLAPNAEVALDVLTRGFQENGDKAGDLLDTFTEYGTQFRELGLDAADATGLLSQGLRAGARDADTVADALKEFAIRAQDGSETTAKGFETIGLNAKAMTKAIAEGGPGAKRALGQVLDGLRKIEDPAKRNAAAVELFGTKAEDLQDALFALDTKTAADGLGDVAGAAERAGTALNDNAATKIETFKRKVQVAFVDFLGNKVIPAAQELYEEFQNGTGPGGEIREVLEDLKDTAQDLWPEVKAVLETSAKFAKFAIDNKDVFIPIAAGVAAYAAAMKLAALHTGVMAAFNLGAMATGIGGVGAASAGAAVGVGAFALPLAAAAASLAALYIALKRVSEDPLAQANTVNGTKTVTIGDTDLDSQGRPIPKRGPVPVTFGGNKPPSRNGDDNREPRNARLVVQSTSNVVLDGKVVASAATRANQQRYSRGYMPAMP